MTIYNYDINSNLSVDIEISSGRVDSDTVSLSVYDYSLNEFVYNAKQRFSGFCHACIISTMLGNLIGMRFNNQFVNSWQTETSPNLIGLGSLVIPECECD